MKTDGILVSTRAGRREWIGLAVLALPTLLVSMDATVTYLALPSISASLKPTGSELLWITDMYTFMEGGFLIIMGVLGDRVGRKRLLMMGFISFSLASLIAAFASSPLMLIAARALLGITGAIILPCTLSLIRNMFHDERQRTIAFGIYTACYSGGTMLGPLIGGILLTYFWWGSVFLISVPLMLIFLLASSLLPEYSDEDAKQFNIVNALLLITGMLLAIYGIKRLAESGALDWWASLTILVGIIISSVFVYTQKHIRNPLIDINLFKIPVFSATLAILFVSLFCWSGLYLFIAQYLQLVLAFAPLKAGLLTLLPAAITMAGCMLSPQLLRWFKKSSIIVWGSLIMGAGMVIITQLSITAALGWIILACTCLSMGCGFIVTLGIDMVVSSAPKEQAGAVSGISETSTTFGTAFGVALLGSIGTAIYHREMARTIQPDLMVTEESTHTLGGALAAAGHLPKHLGSALIENARSAFMNSFHSAAIVAGILILTTVAIFAVALRK